MKRSSIKRDLLVSLVVFLLSVTCAWAQTATTSIRGTVTDPKGSSVPNAEVTLVNADTGFSRTIKTDKDGSYQFLQIPPATYTLTTSDYGGSSRNDPGCEHPGCHLGQLFQSYPD
jgi:hypothetical protein